MTSPEDSGLSDPDDATCALHYSWELPGCLSASRLTASVVLRFASLPNLLQTPVQVTSTSSSYLIPSQQNCFPPPPHPCFFLLLLFLYYLCPHQHSPPQLLLKEALSCLSLCYLKTACPPPAPFEHKDQCHLWNNE